MGLRLRVLFGLALAAAVAAEPAMAYRYGRHYSSGAMRHRSIQAIRMQVAYFESMAAQAEKVADEARAQVNAANSRISGDREAIATARDDGRQASKDLADAEAEVYSEKGEESEIVKAKGQYEAARAALQAAEAHALQSPAYKAEVARSAEEPERGSELARVREKALNESDEYQHALTMWDVARKRFNNDKPEVLSRDEHWLSASEAKRKTLLAESKAINDAKAGGMHKLNASQTLHEAERVAAQSRAYAAMGRGMLGAMGAGMPGPGRTTPPDTPTRSAGN